MPLVKDLVFSMDHIVNMIAGMKEYVKSSGYQVIDKEDGLIFQRDDILVVKDINNYTIIDQRHLTPTVTYVINDNDNSNSFNPLRQYATLKAINSIGECLNRIHDRNNGSPTTIVIPSGEGKTTLVNRYNERVVDGAVEIIPEKPINNSPLNFEHNSQLTDYDGLHIHENLQHIHNPDLLLQKVVETFPMVYKKHYHKTTVISPYNLEPLTKERPLIVMLLPNPTYCNANIIGRSLAPPDHIIVTRRVRNCSVIIYSRIALILRHRRTQNIHTHYFTSFDVFTN